MPRQPKKLPLGISEGEIVSRHFAHLTRLLQEEQKEDRERFRSQVLIKKPEERERMGKMLRALNLFEMHYNPSGHRLVTFGYAHQKWLPRYSLDVGDVVRLSGFKTPEHECPVGTVYERDRAKITVAFRAELPGWVGRESLYQLDLSENLSTYERMYEALREVGRSEHCRVSHLRNISLGLRHAKPGDPVRPEDLKFFNGSLNPEQQKAVSMAMEAEDFLLIHGPPGTGKTSVLIEIIRQARKAGGSVLVSAPSNAACDHLLECLVAAGEPVTRLGHPARVTEIHRAHTLQYKLASHPFVKLIDENEASLAQLTRQKERRQDRRAMTWDEKKEMQERIGALKKNNRELRAQIFAQVWNASDIVVATHTASGDAILKGRTFDWVILDEATQATEPASWIPVLRAAKKVVLAGDHFQLPPTVFSPKTGPDSLRFTLFERLHEVLAPEFKLRLGIQYRMHEEIMQFSSAEFYEGKLVADEKVRRHLLTDLPGVDANDWTRGAVVFLDTTGLGYEEKVEPGTESRFNEEEARLVKIEYDHLIKSGLREKEIAVTSPYSAQVKLLTGLLAHEDDSKTEGTSRSEIDSVDAFQGREKEAVIVSLVRSNLTGQLGFLEDTRRMNVAMTRARRKLIVIGDSATLSTIRHYQDFIQYTEKIKAYRSAWEYI